MNHLNRLLRYISRCHTNRNLTFDRVNIGFISHSPVSFFQQQYGRDICRVFQCDFLNGIWKIYVLNLVLIFVIGMKSSLPVKTIGFKNNEKSPDAVCDSFNAVFVASSFLPESITLENKQDKVVKCNAALGSVHCLKLSVFFRAHYCKQYFRLVTFKTCLIPDATASQSKQSR